VSLFDFTAPRPRKQNMHGFGKSLCSRRLSAFLTLLLSLLLSHPETAGANPKEPLPAGPRILDKGRIHALYLQGDFRSVIAATDSFMLGGKPYSRADSVFIAKHLAVVYTANPATRELGREYMFTLLALLPTAMILDMFVSDEIDHIFGTVQEEYAQKRQALGNAPPSNLESSRYAVDKLDGTDPDPAGTAEQKPVAKPLLSKGPSPVFFWVAGGVTLAAVAGYYFLQSQSENKPEDRVIIVSQ
jgi:hypothetical protein